MTTNPFDGLWVPLHKAEESHHGETKRVIYGIASTEDCDAQGETVLASGIDFASFLERGFFNWNHSHAPEDQVGEPLEARVVTNEFGVQGSGLLVKGVLFNDVPRADSIWSLMESMRKGNTRRKLGYSIEGSCQRGPAGLVSRSIVDHIAVTHEPINTRTWADISKSLAKSMTTTSAAALMTEDLHDISSQLFGSSCVCGEWNGNEYPSGRRGAIKHLMHCHGMSGDQATASLSKLYRSRVF